MAQRRRSRPGRTAATANPPATSPALSRPARENVKPDRRYADGGGDEPAGRARNRDGPPGRGGRGDEGETGEDVGMHHRPHRGDDRGAERPEGVRILAEARKPEPRPADELRGRPHGLEGGDGDEGTDRDRRKFACEGLRDGRGEHGGAPHLEHRVDPATGGMDEQRRGQDHGEAEPRNRPRPDRPGPQAVHEGPEPGDQERGEREVDRKDDREIVVRKLRVAPAPQHEREGHEGDDQHGRPETDRRAGSRAPGVSVGARPLVHGGMCHRPFIGTRVLRHRRTCVRPSRPRCQVGSEPVVAPE